MTDVLDFQKKQQERQQAELADQVAEELGVTAEGLANMIGEPADAVRAGLLEAVRRQALYRTIDERQAARERAQGRDPNECHNLMCPEQRQSEHEHTNPKTGEVTYSGRSNYCHTEDAIGCIFRMTEQPPSDPFVSYPSYPECVRILQRIGYIRPDGFGFSSGTDFMLHQQTRRLWVAFVLLLTESGKVRLDPEELKKLEHLDRDDAVFIANDDSADEHYREHLAGESTATVEELLAQRNALLLFIRGELDWPYGRCPCGGDVDRDGVSHTPNCRLKGAP